MYLASGEFESHSPHLYTRVDDAELTRFVLDLLPLSLPP
jgi:hypothetical protein